MRARSHWNVKPSSRVISVARLWACAFLGNVNGSFLLISITNSSAENLYSARLQLRERSVMRSTVSFPPKKIRFSSNENDPDTLEAWFPRIPLHNYVFHIIFRKVIHERFRVGNVWPSCLSNVHIRIHHIISSILTSAFYALMLFVEIFSPIVKALASLAVWQQLSSFHSQLKLNYSMGSTTYQSHSRVIIVSTCAQLVQC